MFGRACEDFASGTRRLSDYQTSEGNLPRAARLRARYLNGNNPVRQNSDTVNVVTIPQRQ